MLELRHVTKTYPAAAGPVHALRDVSLSIAAGEFVAIRGPSGCGKSTLLMVAGGMTRPTSGEVLVGGESLAAMSPAALTTFRATQIGFVFQLFHLLPYLNVLDNVLAAGNRSAPRVERAHMLLDRFGLAHRLTHRPAELSVGERQRVAMARAMLPEPKLLLADEPTGNLDATSAAAVLDLLTQFHHTGGAILLVTHDNHAAARAQRTVQMQQGRIADVERS